MEQRDEWMDDDTGDFGEGDEDVPEVDARTAAWMTSVSPLAAGRYLNLPLPEPPRCAPGTGPNWHEKAVADVLTECYAKRMLDPNREMVEAIAISIMPMPPDALDEDGDEIPSPFGPSPLRRWEMAVADVSEKVSGMLRYGPTAGFTAGEVVVSGAEYGVVESGVCFRQRVDLLWEHPDGSLSAVIVAGEPDCGQPPRPPAEDWRVILAAEILASGYGRIPEVHLVRVDSGVVQVTKPSHKHLENSVYRLSRAAREATESYRATDEEGWEIGYTYPVTSAAVTPLQRGDWPGGRPRPMNRPGNGRPRR